ncbi:acyltransferase family protein [Solitalea koreensis]|uniref:Peptidoglycan/LPS O-acetylase OafA/YrhL, contains acyltransferase and SGNH-hydrolase domains n=1 Tax=Solitalea koreensis TaxID=543615 RepID=A0A521DB52_9SPHI|nr:acyltransferase [Solitalea koreensis]SMO68868.1 Peptidoglycan/LPS O-acetylase OafA/YrhL, contains acyltransferase and SGNH-hydrolase domains [Solitalea koreensis]
MAKKRIYSLDALRGITALFIVFYHVSFWQHQSMFDEGTWLTKKLGLYVVELFYMLSGVSLGYIYFEKFNKIDTAELTRFFIKRFFRIGPLYILLCIAAIFVYQIPHSIDTVKKLLINCTLLFGLFNPAYSMLTGGWSIGVEFFFYVFFPILVFLAHKNKMFDYSITVLLVCCNFAWAILMMRYPTLGDGWLGYVYPLNHFIYFWLGVLISRLDKMHNNWSYLIMGIVLFVFTGFNFEKTNDYSIELVSGLNRLLLSASVGLIVFFFYLKVEFKHERINHFFDWLASISFSLYLIHPFVYLYLMKLNAAYQWNLHFYSILSITLVSAVLLGRVLFIYEKFFMDLGNKLVAKV